MTVLFTGVHKMARRTGIPTMLKDAKNLVRIITKFLPVVQQEYEGNDELIQTLVDCANCLTGLIEEAGKVRRRGD